jgi:hypothetical protein
MQKRTRKKQLTTNSTLIHAKTITMQAKLFFAFLLTGSLFSLSCNLNKSDESDKTDDIGKAATQYCDCITKQTEKVSSKLRKVIIQASKEDDPETALKEELEKNDLSQEFKESIDTDEADNCGKKAAKKYDLDVDDKKVQKKVLAKIEDDDDCDLAAAFLRFSLKKEGGKKPTKEEPEVNNNTGDDANKAADELCNCLSAKFPDPSDGLKSFMKKIGESDDPMATYNSEAKKLGNEERTTLSEEFSRLVQIDDEAMKECSGKIMKYQIQAKNQEERSKKILSIMVGKNGCEVPSGQWAMAAQKAYKN